LIQHTSSFDISIFNQLPTFQRFAEDFSLAASHLQAQEINQLNSMSFWQNPFEHLQVFC
jgi:hypothetical protein